jgi:hypothetical protein
MIALGIVGSQIESPETKNFRAICQDFGFTKFVFSDMDFSDDSGSCRRLSLHESLMDPYLFPLFP